MKGEFELIDDIRKMFPAPEGILGIGDDCAVIPQEQGVETLVSTDMLVEGTHFLLEDISPYQLGWKSAASNFSDIAAMGGIPVGSFLALALPKDADRELVYGFLEGYKAISELYSFPLLGGDITSSKERMSICVTVLGRARAGSSRKRASAVPGDLVCVTGCLGDSAAGLQAVLRGIPRDEDVSFLIERHYLPHPRLEEGRRLAACPGVHAMMDISDGIGSDLRHILEESGTGAEVDLAAVPVSDRMKAFSRRHGLDVLELAVSGGEDYELLFTVAPEAEPLLDVGHAVIGRITPGSGIVWKGSEKDFSGYRHF